MSDTWIHRTIVVEFAGESLVEIRLGAVVEGIELAFTHSRLRDEETRRSHGQGWNGALDKLERRFLQANEATAQRDVSRRCGRS